MAGGGGGATTEDSPEWKKAVGITMALLGSFFIGAAFIFQKKAHMAKVSGETGGELAYLKSPLWWAGMVMSADFSLLQIARPCLEFCV
jgi:hypothetical protein